MLAGNNKIPANFTIKNMGVIYKIQSPSGKTYVGKTYDLRKRINAHKRSVRKGSSIILHNSIRKYGWDAHILSVIEEVDDEKLNEREILWIAELKTYCYEHKMGLNMTKGGDGQRSTWMHKTELRKWVSNKFSGDGNPFYDKKHTEETKKIIGEKASKRNKESGRTIPKWGAEKGRKLIIKPVISYTNDGIFFKEYESGTLAAKELKINRSCITDSLRFGSWVNGQYIFKYKTENYPLKIEVGEIKIKTEKRPVLTLDINFQVICEHPSAQEASDFWGITKTTINRAAQYNWLKPIRSGHVFIYTDLYAEIEKLTA